VKESHHSASSDDSKHTSIDSLNSVGKAKKTERNSVSSDDSANVELRNNSTLYGKIINRSQNDLNDANKHAKNVGESACGESAVQNINLAESERKLDESVTDATTFSIGESNKNLGDHSSNTKDDDKSPSENEDLKPERHYIEKIESDILMFGCDVPKPVIDGNLELSSDQDSTAGEDEEFTDEEDIENLHPEMLLYKAATAHNLPVMCAALAAGADKLWSNVNDKSRSALHQAIISVRDSFSSSFRQQFLQNITIYVQ